MRRLQQFMMLVLVICLVFAVGIQAMSSNSYRLDWMAWPSGGGGAGSSTSYAAYITVGQTAVGEMTSATYASGIGFWYGVFSQWRIYLPIVLK